MSVCWNLLIVQGDIIKQYNLKHEVNYLLLSCFNKYIFLNKGKYQQNGN